MDSSGRIIADSSGQQTMDLDNQSMTDFGDPATMDSSNQIAADSSNQTSADSSEVRAEDQDFAGDNYDSLFDSYSQIPNMPAVTSLAFPASDLDGDDAMDLLVMNISSEPDTKTFNSNVSAISGADGRILWQKEYPGSLVFAMTAGDLNDDGKTDIMVDEIMAEEGLSLHSSISILDGEDGLEIWSLPQMMAMTLAYPIRDVDGDDASEILVHTFGIDSINSSISTRISRVSGKEGTTLDERIFSDGLAIEYPSGNLTSDDLQDSIIAIYHMNSSTISNINDDIMNITATTFEAIDGDERIALWEKSFDGLAVALPATDLTGDDLDELAVYLIRYAENGSISNDIAVLQGSDGEVLWEKSFGGSMALAVPGVDHTGEGLRDLIIYRQLGSEGSGSEVLAVKGDDGRLLWSRPGMVYIPSGLLSEDLLSFLPVPL
ncbi:MAG: hypothetical protein ACP5OU_07870 [Methanothrix sp.]